MSKCVQFKATGISKDEKATGDDTSFSGAAKALKEDRVLDMTPHTSEVVGSSHAATRKNLTKACPTYSMPKAPWRSDQSHDKVDTGLPDGINAVKHRSKTLPSVLNRSPELDLSSTQMERNGHSEDGKEKGGVHLLAKSVSISVNGAVHSDANERKGSKCSDQQRITLDRNVSCGLSVVEAELAKAHHVRNTVA